MTIAYLAELVLAVAAGFGLLHVEERVLGVPNAFNYLGGVLHAQFYVVTGMSLVGLAGLVIEVALRRSPAHWGLGRWTWAIAGLFAVSHLLGQLPNLVTHYRAGFRWQTIWSLFFSGPVGQSLALVLISVWITTCLARLPRDPAPDAREWAGRALGAAVLLSFCLRFTVY